MEQLKAYVALINELDPTPCQEVYLKSDADKVIAELEAQKAQAEDDCAYWKTMSRKCTDDNEVMAKQRADAFKRERHQKYKRCLAMVAYCDLKMSYWAIREIHEGDTGKFELYSKWHERWLQLAEKFKEAK